ncbi:Transcriptional activator spt7 [Tulasnella sp. 419]|nr:Transcriptional activator spt7 [Tulasnella sp. 419]
MKHLLEALDGRLNVLASETELKQLLNDVRDSKDSKSSENFYETLEKVLAELRTTEHATAFLRPVRRSEAPYYDTVIKHPMDLQTMLKKVKAHAYKNKKEFADDLNLIWDNCLTYNSDLAHPLRRSAHFMRKKADHILERITDKNERPQPIQLRAFKPPTAQHYSKSRTIESSDEESGPGDHSTYVNGISSHLTNGVPINGTVSIPNHSTTQSNGQESLSANGRVKDSSHETLLGKRRLPRVDDMPFGDRRAIIRSSEAMSTFRDMDLELQRHLESEGAGSSKASSSLAFHQFDFGGRTSKLRPYASDDSSWFSPLHNDGQIVTSTKRTQVPVESGQQGDVDGSRTDRQLLGGWWKAVTEDTLRGAGVPDLPQSSKRPAARSPLKQKRKRTKRQKIHDTSENGLEALMHRNINTLRNIRKAHSQLVAFHAGLELRPPPPSQQITGHLDRRKPIPLEGGSNVARKRLGAHTTAVLEHAGFEGASKVALSVLTDVAIDYIQNLGRTLRFYCDKYAHAMTPEEIVLHTLFENGTTEIQELERHIKDDIERYGTKLLDLERKLEHAYREQVESVVIEDDMLFDEGGEALVSGNFTEELGEDFFGFRALGLDKELGLSSFVVPSRLFHGRSKRQDISTSNGVGNLEPPPPYEPPPQFIPLSHSSLELHPGLLSSFYRERFDKLTATNHNSTSSLQPPGIAQAPVNVLPDDPPNPLRVKAGPLGQISLPVAGAKPKASKPPGPGKGHSKKKAGGSPADDDGPEQDGTGSPSKMDSSAVQAIPAVTITPSKKKKGGGNAKKSAMPPTSISTDALQTGTVVMASA